MQSGTDRINKKRTLERGERGLRLQSPRLIVSGVTGKRGKRGKRRERKKKSNNRREEEDNKEADLLQLAAVPTTACFCKLARIYFFKEGAQHPQEKYVRSPNDVDSSTTATTSKIYPPPPPIFHANQPTSRGIAGTEQANGSLCGERLSLMMELKDVMDGWNSWFFSEKNGENCNMDI